MPRDGSGVYQLPPGTEAISESTILSSMFNAFVQDLEQDLNTPRPIGSGGTGAADEAGARHELGVDVVAALGGSYTAGGTAAAATVTIVEVWESLATGQVLALKMPNAATGATTLNVTVPGAGPLGAKAIRRQGDTAIQADDWPANAILFLRYDGSYNGAAGAWVLMGIPALVPRVIRTQVFTASGTYTPHANMISCIIECVGGGGAGGGATATVGTGFGGGGGGSGAYSRKVATKADVGASKPVTIGAGGTGASGANGGSGGTTSVGTLCTAPGGSGGNHGSGPTGSQGGAGGVTGTGDLTTRGNGGVPGSYNNTTAIPAMMGSGGGSHFGGATSGATSANSAGIAATANTGAGGSGGSIVNVAASVAGGAGASGIVVITELCSA